MKKGKILKIRLGHEANCSSGMILVAMLFASAVTHLPTAAITAGIQARQARQKGMVSSKTMLGSQIVGLVFTVGMFLYGVTSGYGESFLGLMALVLGGAYAMAVSIGSRLAPKIGYWNILVVPFIQVGSLIISYFVWAVLASAM